MNGDLARIFGVRRGEARPASLLFFYLFVMLGAYIMGKSVGDALFLAVFPKHLPYAMIGSAVVIGLFISAYIRLSHRLQLQTLIICTLLFFSFSFVVFWEIAQYPYRPVYLLIYAWVYALGAIGPMMGWTLANYTLTTREARRLFGFIGAGAILGATFVGFFTADVMNHGHLRPKTLLLVVAALPAIGAALVKLLFRGAGMRPAAVGPNPGGAASSPRNFTQSVKLIRSLRYLLLITALIAIGCLATSILDYQFKLIAKAAYGHNTAALAAFFGRFNGYMGLATFVFQLALTGPLLRVFGIRVTLFVLPTVLMGSSAGVLLAPGLISGSILRGSHYLLRYSLDTSSRELLYLPVSPEVKSQVKSFIDTFIWRSADGVAGLTLLFFANTLKFSPAQVSLVNMFILLAWIAVAYGVRGEYLNVLRKAIERRTLDPERASAGVGGVLDSTTAQVLAMSLEHGSEQQVLYGLRLFEMGRNPASHPALRRLLEHPAPAVRQKALQLLAAAADRSVLPAAERLLADEAPEVRTEALHYLVEIAGRDPLELLQSENHFTDYSVPGAVISYLARTGDPDNLATAHLILQGMLTRSGEEAARARAQAARALGVIPAPCELHHELVQLLCDEDADVRRQALLSAGKIRSVDLLPLVIERLGDRRLVVAARAALSEYGALAVDALEISLNDENLPIAVRSKIPGVLAGICTAESAAALANSLIQSDPGLRYDLLKALNKVRRRAPGFLPQDTDFADFLNLEAIGYYRSLQILEAFFSGSGDYEGTSPSDNGPLLARALRERMDYEFERIFRVLALLYPARDIHNAYLGLRSRRPQLRANALEVLEHMLRPEHYRLLAPVLDAEVSDKERLNFARRLCRTEITSRTEALRVLLHSEDRWLKLCSLHAIGELGISGMHDDLQRVEHDGDALLEETWSWASARLGRTADKIQGRQQSAQ